jgi:hypothetical protein
MYVKRPLPQPDTHDTKNKHEIQGNNPAFIVFGVLFMLFPGHSRFSGTYQNYFSAISALLQRLPVRLNQITLANLSEFKADHRPLGVAYVEQIA